MSHMYFICWMVFQYVTIIMVIPPLMLFFMTHGPGWHSEESHGILSMATGAASPILMCCMSLLCHDCWDVQYLAWKYYSSKLIHVKWSTICRSCFSGFPTRFLSLFVCFLEGVIKSDSISQKCRCAWIYIWIYIYIYISYIHWFQWNPQFPCSFELSWMAKKRPNFLIFLCSFHPHGNQDLDGVVEEVFKLLPRRMTSLGMS
jgi:hypothetical protein